MPYGTWLLTQYGGSEESRDLYVKFKKVNDSLEDEWLRLDAELHDLPSEKEMIKIRRRLGKVNKLKIKAHKAMYEAWEALKNGH